MSSKRFLAFSCGVEVALVQWKKRDCFPVRGAFWENRGSAYRSQPSKGFERALTSPLLKSFHSSKRATSSLIQEHFTCLCPSTSVQPHRREAAVRIFAQVHGKHSVKEPSVHPHTVKAVHFGNFNLSAFFACLDCLCNPAAWPLSSDKVEESTDLPANTGLWVLPLSHLEGTCQGNICCI